MNITPSLPQQNQSTQNSNSGMRSTALSSLPRPQPTPIRSSLGKIDPHEYQKYIQRQHMARISQTPVGLNNGNPLPYIGQTPNLQQSMLMRPPQRIQITNRPMEKRTPAAKTNQRPSQNTYAPRLKRGFTSLMHRPETEEKRKRSRFLEPEEEEEDSDMASYSDSEDGESRRRSTREHSRQINEALESTPQTDSLVIEDEPVAPFKVPKRPSKLPVTKHDFEKLSICRSELVSSSIEVLVPLRIEIEVDGFKIQDQFTWNLNEQAISIQKFAEYLCDDLGLHNTHHATLVRMIKSQIDNYKKYFMVADAPVPEDTRITIRLDINVGKVHLRDRFEWDLSSDITPERFAKTLVSDLQLGGEFTALIAHSIHEQIHQAKQIGDFETNFAIEKPFRSEEEARGWAPLIDCGDISDDEVENMEEDRKQRLMRRQQRLSLSQKRGVSLESNYYIPPLQIAMTQPHVMQLPPELRDKWRCSHCLCHISKTNGLQDGPAGVKTLCQVCGQYYGLSGQLPIHRLHMFK